MISVKNVSRIYYNNKEPFYALRDFSYEFPDHGLFCICGKSGSGKTTLANIITLVDKPSRGRVEIKGTDISKLKAKNLERFRLNNIGIIFQNYHLLIEETPLYNVMLPLLIKGESEYRAKRKASIQLKEMNIDDKLFNNKAKNLSGGEMQRVAIARALINNPNIIIADEPTGALDEANSIKTMEILREISKTKLVITISHNEKLVERFADEIIYLKDGQLDKTAKINHKRMEVSRRKNDKPEKKGLNFWEYKKGIKNLSIHASKNIISIFSLIFSVVSLIMIFGFYEGSQTAIKEVSNRQFDYGSATIAKVVSLSKNNSSLKLKKSIRMNNYELEFIRNDLLDYQIEYNFDALINEYPIMRYEDDVLSTFSFKPIYDYQGSYMNDSLIIRGNVPYNDPYGIIVNDVAEEYLKSTYHVSSVIGINIKIDVEKEFYYYYMDEDVEKSILDTFAYDKTFTIYGVCNEFSFLNTPKIYYNYSTLLNYFSDTVLNNLSEYYERDITWYDYIADSANDSALSSYSHRIFLKNSSNISNLDNLIEKYNENNYIYIESSAYTVKSSFSQLINASTLGVGMFVAIALIGAILIIGISSYSSFVFEKKNNAIMSVLGASRESIDKIYIFENIIVGLIGAVSSIIISFLVEEPLNKLLKYFFNIDGLIKVPFFTFFDSKYLFISLIILAVLVISIFSTWIPLMFAKKISIKEELNQE